MTVTPVTMSENVGGMSKELKRIVRKIDRKKRRRKARIKKVDVKFIGGKGYIPLPKTYFKRNYEYNPYNNSSFDKNVNARIKYTSTITKTVDLKVQGGSIAPPLTIRYQYDEDNNMIDNLQIWKTGYHNKGIKCSQCKFWEEKHKTCKHMIPIIWNEDICEAGVIKDD